ncbi:MAG: anti-sigma factor antagonist [Firmicutes bacterium]|nr:anti-sigma factor antagonist [Bacillota bacterium]
MRLELRRQGTILLARCAGDLDVASAPAFRERIDRQLHRYPQIIRLVINLEKVDFIDSSGLASLLGRYKEMQRRRGQVFLVGLRPQAYRLCQLSGLCKLVHVADSESSALARVEPRP